MGTTAIIHSFRVIENVCACTVHINAFCRHSAASMRKFNFHQKWNETFKSTHKLIWVQENDSGTASISNVAAVSVSNACLISIATNARNIVCFATNLRRSKSKAKWTRTLVLLLLLLLLFPQSAVIFIFFAVVSCSDAHENYNEAQPANNQSEWQRRQ